MPWLCLLKHDWLMLSPNRRTCLRCKRYEFQSHWRAVDGRDEHMWLKEGR